MPTWETGAAPMNENHKYIPLNCQKNLIQGFLTLIIVLVRVAGNTAVLWLLSFHMERNIFSIYILNLARADFLFLCFQIIDYLQTLIDFFHSIPILIPRFFIFGSTFAYLAGESTLSAWSTECCMSVLWPNWYRCSCWRHTSAVTCALICALSLLLSILEGKYCGLVIREYEYYWCWTFDFIITTWLFVLFVILSGSSLTLTIRILCGSQRMPLTSMYVTIGLTVLVFLFFVLPFGIYWFLLMWIPNYHNAIPCGSYLVTVVLSCVNSCANPINCLLDCSFGQQWWKWEPSS